MFENKINEVLGEAMETQAWLDQALDCQYLSAEQHAQMDAKWHHVGAILNRMIDTAESLCSAPQPRRKR